jgi:hypothetical protein
MAISRLPALTAGPASQRDREQGREKTTAKLAAGEPTGETEVTILLYSTSRVDPCTKQTPKPNPTTPAVRTAVAVQSMAAACHCLVRARYELREATAKLPRWKKKSGKGPS